MNPRRSGVAVCALLLFGAVGPGAGAQRVADPPDPFSVFDSFRLPNGLKVWYGHLPGASMTSMAVIVPAGWDHDPPQREGTAHLLEHVLLSDRAGRTENELLRELTLRGGTHNGVTTADRTYYPLHIATDHAAFGVRWLHDVVAPRPIPQTVVDANREPVAIEVGAGPRSWFERLTHAWLFHRSLRPRSFWFSEFGLVAEQDRYYDPWTSLAELDVRDLTAFYETFYTTSDMTLVVVSGVPRDALLPVIDSTFGLLPWRPAPARQQIEPMRHDSRRFGWTFRSSTGLRLMYRIPELNGRDHMRLLFVEDMLRHRLMERLRRGSAKAVYSVQATTEMRGPAAFFSIAARVDPRHEHQVRAIIDEELRRIKAAPADTAAFYADRDALGQRLRVQNAAPATLVAWATDRFYRPDLHNEFPALGEYYATVGPDSIAAFIQRLAVPENRILHVTRAAPVSLFWSAVLVLLVAAAAAALYRRITWHAADMSTIRYVVRLRRPCIQRVAGRAVALVLALGVARLVFAGAEILAENVVFTVDSPLLHGSLLGLVVFASALCAMTVAGRVPRKVLVFEDEVRIKSLTYRAEVIAARDIAGARAGRRAVVLLLADGSTRTLPVADPARLTRVLAAVTSANAVPR